jgi:hypothetical protein
MRRLLVIGLLGALVIAGAAVWWSTASRTPRHASSPASRSLPAAVAATPEGQTAPLLGLHMDSRSFSVRGSFHDARGNAYKVGDARRTDRAAECVVVIGPATSSACDEPHLFSRGPVMFIEGFEGGPEPRQRTSEIVTGIAAPAVSAITVVESNGARQAAELSSGNAFFFAMPRADLERGVYIDHLDVLGPGGSLRQTIPLDDSS